MSLPTAMQGESSHVQDSRVSAPRLRHPKETLCHRKRVAQNYSKSTLKIINHRRRRLGEHQRVHKLGTQCACHNARATISQAGLALEYVRHSAHSLEHVRHSCSRAPPQQRRRVAEVLELLAVIVLLAHLGLLLDDVYPARVPARQPRPSQQLFARTHGTAYQLASNPPELGPKALRAPPLQPKKVVHEPTAISSVLQSVGGALARLAEARVANKPLPAKRVHFSIACWQGNGLLATLPNDRNAHISYGIQDRITLRFGFWNEHSE